MPQDELKQTLQSLHEELSRSETIDPELRRLLADVSRDIDHVLQQEPPAAPEGEEPEDFVDRVNSLGSHFEEQHPRLAQIIGRIADGLSQLGI